MFPRPNLYGHGFHQQHPAFFQGYRRQQPNRMPHFGQIGQPGNFFHPMAGPLRFFNGPERLLRPMSPMMMRPYYHLDEGSNRRGKKRQARKNKLPVYKRPKYETALPQTSHSINPQTNSVDDKFIVPVSKGTEQITMGIWTYFLANQMTDEDLQKKLHLRNSLHSVVREAFPNCRLFIVGSSMTGFATKSSDVDMCLMISQKEIDQKGHATAILTCILKALKNCSFMVSPQVIRAKVPILKFFDKISGVECDLNVNNTIGVRNTHMLRYYAHVDWRVRPLMLFIKRWARFHDINDASKKTISSYSFTLMLIHYLQVGINPPVLPCLQKMRPDLFHNKSDVRRLSLGLDDAVSFASQNGATLGELFLGFLNYYSNIFDYDRDAISVRLGARITRREVTSYDNPGQWKCLCIEEPFERSNTARSVYEDFVFWRVLRVFKTSFRTLERTRNVESILSRPF